MLSPRRQKKLAEQRRIADEAVTSFKRAVESDNRELAGLRVFGLNRSLANMQVCWG
jgi:hypothetical protein